MFRAALFLLLSLTVVPAIAAPKRLPIGAVQGPGAQSRAWARR